MANLVMDEDFRKELMRMVQKVVDKGCVWINFVALPNRSAGYQINYQTYAYNQCCVVTSLNGSEGSSILHNMIIQYIQSGIRDEKIQEVLNG